MFQPSRYEIEIRGRVTERVLHPVIDDFRVELTQHDSTRLIGVVRDPSHLNGLLAHLTAMNAEVVELRRLGPAGADGPTSTNPTHQEEGTP